MKLIDFAFSKYHLPDERIRTFCGTLSFMAPEILNKQSYMPKKADVWSLGVVIHRLVVGKVPFRASDCGALYSKIIEHDLSDLVAAPVSCDLKSMIGSMLAVDPCHRPSVAQLIQHAWVKSDGK